jgi:hypothetical protein
MLGYLEIKTILPLDSVTLIQVQKNAEKLPYPHNDTYLPAGVFVPMYGRLVLNEQLQKLGKRVLYHDTDSIKYIVKPNEYNIPESDILGGWEPEDTEHGPIVEFVGTAPKTYGQRFQDGYKKFKCKGISTNYANERAANYDVLIDQVKTHLNGEEKKISYVPQMNFVNQLGGNTETRFTNKKMSFTPEALKGDLVDTFVYPFGYCHDCEKGTCSKNIYHDE